MGKSEAEVLGEAAFPRSRGDGVGEPARGHGAGQVRGDLTIDELLALTAGIAWVGHQAPESAELTSRLFALVRIGIDLPAPA